MGEEAAKKWAAGILSVEDDPVTGELRVFDRSTQTFSPVPEAGPPAGQPMAPPPEQDQQARKTLYQQANDATGLVAAVTRGLGNTIGQLPGVSIGEQAIKAQSDLLLTVKELQRAYRNNPRMPIAEMKNLEGLLSSGALVSPDALRWQIEQLAEATDRKIIEADQAAQFGATTKIKQEAAQSAANLRRFKAQLGSAGKAGVSDENDEFLRREGIRQ
jgi:hypothetical protein